MNISPVQAHSSGAPPTYLDYNCFCALADSADDEVLQLQGPTDPLLHLHFFHMVHHAAERGKRVTATSLLTIFSECRAAECIASGLYAMHVAMDAPDAWLYHELHGKNCFDKVIRNVRRFMAARADAKSRLPLVYLACTVTRKNLPRLPELAQLAHDEHFDAMLAQLPNEERAAQFAGSSVYFQTMRTVHQEERLTCEDPERIAFYFDRTLSRARALNLDLRLPAPAANRRQQSS